MTDLVLVALAAFAVWEFALALSPWSVPPALQPILVVALAAGGFALPTTYVQPLAAAGLVALLHALVRTSPQSDPLVLQRGRQALGRRIPPLP